MTVEDPLAGVLPEPSLSFRGGLRTLPREALRTGERYRHRGALVGTRDVRLATGNFADSDVIAILGQSGFDTAPLSPDSERLEILYPSDVTFTVLAQQPLDDQLWLTIIVMDDEGGAPQFDSGETLRRIGTAVIRARSLPPVDAADPSRYVGAIGVDGNGRQDRVA